MLDLDYEVYVSEWHPIIRCGPRYDRRRIVRYTADPELSDVWGNLVVGRVSPRVVATLDGLDDMNKQVVVRHQSLKGRGR
jgi:hypothetical protein